MTVFCCCSCADTERQRRGNTATAVKIKKCSTFFFIASRLLRSPGHRKASVEERVDVPSEGQTVVEALPTGTVWSKRTAPAVVDSWRSRAPQPVQSAWFRAEPELMDHS